MSTIRESVAAVYESEEQWSAAAAMLAGIELDSGQRVLDPAYKLQTCVKVAQLYLEDEDALNAETFIKKAAFLLPESKGRHACARLEHSPHSCTTHTDEALELQYNTCYARILDAKVRSAASFVPTLLSGSRAAVTSAASWRLRCATTRSASWPSAASAAAWWPRRS